MPKLGGGVVHRNVGIDTSKDHLLHLAYIVLAKAYFDENSQFFNFNK